MYTRSQNGEYRSFATDNIIRDIKDTIYLNNIIWDNVQKSKREALRKNDLSEALYGLDQAMYVLCMIDERLEGLINMIEMEALSAQAQSRAPNNHKVQSK